MKILLLSLCYIIAFEGASVAGEGGILRLIDYMKETDDVATVRIQEKASGRCLAVDAAGVATLRDCDDMGNRPLWILIRSPTPKEVKLLWVESGLILLPPCGTGEGNPLIVGDWSALSSSQAWNLKPTTASFVNLQDRSLKQCVIVKQMLVTIGSCANAAEFKITTVNASGKIKILQLTQVKLEGLLKALKEVITGSVKVSVKVNL